MSTSFSATSSSAAYPEPDDINQTQPHQLNVDALDMDNKDSRLDLLEDLQPPRDHYVNTAIKFLQNPRVRTTSLAQKEKFLKQKGLSNEEIQLAFKKSGAYADEKNNKNRLALETSPTNARDLAYYNYQSSVWFKIKEIANVLAVFSLGAYGIHQLWVRVLGPKFFGIKKNNENENVQNQLFQSISQLNENVSELKQLILRLTNAAENGSNFGNRLNSNGGSNYEFQELKQELSAIKGLLLNRHQFPSSPGIPSWQMLETEEDVGLDAETESPPSISMGSTGSGLPTSRRKRDRKSNPGGRKSESGGGDDEKLDLDSKPSSSVERKTSSNDSNNGLYSGSSCEVVFMGGKNDSSDHSDD